MTCNRTKGMFAVLAVSAALVAQLAATHAHAGKEVFVRSKPHVNVGTIGGTSSSQQTVKPAFSNGEQDSNGGLGGPRKDKIDLSVCELATFDFDKCLN